MREGEKGLGSHFLLLCVEAEMEMKGTAMEAAALKQGCSQKAARKSHPENKAADR